LRLFVLLQTGICPLLTRFLTAEWDRPMIFATCFVESKTGKLVKALPSRVFCCLSSITYLCYNPIFVIKNPLYNLYVKGAPHRSFNFLLVFRSMFKGVSHHNLLYTIYAFTLFLFFCISKNFFNKVAGWYFTRPSLFSLCSTICCINFSGCYFYPKRINVFAS